MDNRKILKIGEAAEKLGVFIEPLEGGDLINKYKTVFSIGISSAYFGKRPGL